MSRVGKKPIEIPQGVEVKKDQDILKVKGPKGELQLALHANIDIEQNENILLIKTAKEQDTSQRALWGLFRSLINNMIIGVTQGFEKKLEINGVGFAVSLSGNKLVLKVGFSHPVEFILPQGITAVVEKNIITISGINKQQVGEVAANIRKIKKPEPYKGKGIKYLDEVIIRKVGKSAGKSAE